MNLKKKISIISPCYNEEECIEELYKRVTAVTDTIDRYEFDYLFIDNSSTDSTLKKLRKICAEDKRVKVIVNTRNFGHLRSPYYGLLMTDGAATVYLASDLQDPPELIPDFLEKWEEGAKVVLAVKPTSDANQFMHNLRRMYYRVLERISDVPVVRDATGFGLYDKIVLDTIRKIGDPYPYFRGLICELGYRTETIFFSQPRRIRGISKNNFYSLYDIAMLGIISHSMVPIRIASILGLLLGLCSFLLAFLLLALKLALWDSIPMGVAPVGIVILFLFGVVLVFIGILGEYIGSIHTHIKKRPVVVEQERINF